MPRPCSRKTPESSSSPPGGKEGARDFNTAKEKEAILEEIARLKEPEKQFILGWCAHAAATAKAEDGKKA